MCKLYFKELILFYYTILLSVCAVKSENIYKNSHVKSNTNPKDVVLHDMYMAFSPIATNNSTKYIESVVTHMYNFQFNKNPNTKSAMIFKLPHTGNALYEYNENHQQQSQQKQQLSEIMVFMERQQFMKPTFPNLTKSYMTLRRFKFSKQAPNSNITEIMLKEMRDIDRQTFHNGWSHLGLNGWNGDIAEPSKSHDHINNNRLPSNSLNDYPLVEITKDLTEVGSKSEYLQEVAANALMENNDRVAMVNELDNNVFIARANDPFGYSTKWQMKKSNQTKSKRDVLRLYSMIKCSTGCEPLVYKGYGCYCGFLGHGVATDGIDRCCKLHDKCYEHSNCISYLEYFVPYVWKCYRGKPLCAIDHGEWGGPDSCAARLCYCDLRLSRCLRQFACPGKRAVCRSSVSRRLQNFLLVK